jgi:hypothetical protein
MTRLVSSFAPGIFFAPYGFGTHAHGTSLTIRNIHENTLPQGWAEMEQVLASLDAKATITRTMNELVAVGGVRELPVTFGTKRTSITRRRLYGCFL